MKLTGLTLFRLKEPETSFQSLESNQKHVKKIQKNSNDSKEKTKIVIFIIYALW